MIWLVAAALVVWANFVSSAARKLTTLIVACGGIAVALLQHASNVNTERSLAEEKSVVVTAARDPSCSGEFSVLVTVENHNTKTLKQVTFRLEAYRDGDSTNLARYPNESTKWTGVVDPGMVSKACYSSGNLTYSGPDVVFHADVYAWRNEFYRDGEFIPPGYHGSSPEYWKKHHD